MEELLKCPFCGNECATICELTNYYGNGISRWTCECGNEDCRALINKTAGTREEAIEAWNRRA